MAVRRGGRGMRVLLTGATGFIGSHLARLLLSQGHEVQAIIRPGSDRWRICDIAEHLTILECDLGDLVGAMGRVRASRPDICIHLAWRGWSGTSAPAEDNVSSLSVGLELMRGVARLGCRTFVGAGTCFEYGMTYDLLTERTPLRPHDLYGTCKNSLFQVAQQFSRISGLHVIWPRIFYSYGPYEDTRRLVPSIVLALLRGEIAKVTPGQQIRDYLHVEDVASAIWAVAQSNHAGAINIAFGSPVSIAEIAQQLGQIVGRPHLIRLGALPYREGEPMVIRADATMLQRDIGWSPEFDLKRGLVQTVEWWRARMSYAGS